MPGMEASRVRRIEALVARMQSIPDAAIRADFSELMESVLELHGSGLERILEIVQATGETGRLAIAHLAAEPLVSSLLVLHGIHPEDLETRVCNALGRLRGAELVSLDDGKVRVRVPFGGRNESSLELLREAVPDAAGIVIEEAPAPGGFVPLASIVACAPKGT
jgi:hypothetical protein